MGWQSTSLEPFHGEAALTVETAGNSKTDEEEEEEEEDTLVGSSKGNFGNSEPLKGDGSEKVASANEQGGLERLSNTMETAHQSSTITKTRKNSGKEYTAAGAADAARIEPISISSSPQETLPPTHDSPSSSSSSNNNNNNNNRSSSKQTRQDMYNKKRKDDRCQPLPRQLDKPITAAFSICEPPPTTESTAFQAGFHDGTAMIVCNSVHYKAPLARLQHLPPASTATAASTAPLFMIGVMSSPEKRNRRDAIRATWGKHLTGRLYFVMAGEWSDVKQEYQDQQDVIWVDRPELYEDLTYKTGVLVSVVEQHTVKGSFTSLLKTDDDIYWNMLELTRVFSLGGEAHATDYYGNCIVGRSFPYRPYQKKQLSQYMQKFIIDKIEYPERCFPPYCFGWGYTMSRRFTECIVREMPSIRFVRFEDVWIGLLAERCDVEVTNLRDFDQWQHAWTEETWRVNMTGKIMQHPVRTAEDMQTRHNSVVG